MRLLAIIACLVVSVDAYAQDVSTLNQPVQPVGEFTLFDSQGKPLQPGDLKGKVWIAHFFFTTCTSGCEKTAETMKALQKAFKGRDDVALVSISLNNDAPGILDLYADNLGADLRQWRFLTGPTDQVHAIVQQCFFQTAEKNPNPTPGSEIVHSFSLLIVDKDGMIHGYVRDGREADSAGLISAEVGRMTTGRIFLPAVNAALNGTCAVLLVAGYLAIRRRRETLHIALMLSALVVSTIFLASYLYYHIVIRGGQSTHFQGEGVMRLLYFAILLTHTVLAAVVAPLALFVAYQGLRDRRLRHVRLAKWTLPIWLYVSVTGVVVYLMLYHL